MGRVTSKLTRPLRTFNVENRAAKVMQNQTENPKAAPKHPSTEKAMSQLQYEHPEMLEAQQVKNEFLHENLKKIFVDTKDAPIEIKSAARPLPVSRKPALETDLGAMDVEYVIPDGRADLKTILGFISLQQIDPANVTAERIASEHKLDKQEVDNVLRYFKALQLHIPQAMYNERPKLKKIMDEQLSVSTGALSQFTLSDNEKRQKQLEDGDVSTDPPFKT